MVTLALAGDVMLGRGVNDELKHMRPGEPWGDVLPLLRGADVTIVNLECAITTHEQQWSRTPKVFHFRANPQAVEVLKAAHVAAASLANNHTLDFDTQGLLDTLAHLDRAGIHHAGAGRDLAQAARPAIVNVPGSGERVGLVAFSDNEAPFAVGVNMPGINYLPVSLEPHTLQRVDAAINSARNAGADIVVFSNHWGPNMVERPPPHFQAFARKVIDLGADVYYGHSAHLFQGVEIYRGKPILYDTGDFLDDYAIDPVLRNDQSFLFRLTLNKCCLRRVELFPVLLTFAKVQRATGAERGSIMKRMLKLSSEMGTRFEQREDRLIQ